MMELFKNCKHKGTFANCNPEAYIDCYQETVERQQQELAKSDKAFLVYQDEANKWIAKWNTEYQRAEQLKATLAVKDAAFKQIILAAQEVINEYYRYGEIFPHECYGKQGSPIERLRKSLQD